MCRHVPKVPYGSYAPGPVLLCHQERIQDFVLGDRLKSPAGQNSPGRRPLGAKPQSPLKLLGFEYRYVESFSVNNFETFCECDEVY
jgi:hypothetical protein